MVSKANFTDQRPTHGPKGKVILCKDTHKRKQKKKTTKVNQRKEEGKDQESIQWSTTPDPRHHMGKCKHTHRETSHTRDPRGQPFPVRQNKLSLNQNDTQYPRHYGSNNKHRTCADPEGDRGSLPPPPPWKIIKIGFPSNIGPDPLKITKLPSQNSMLGHRRHVGKTPFKWADDGPLKVVFGSFLPLSTKKAVLCFPSEPIIFEGPEYEK